MINSARRLFCVFVACLALASPLSAQPPDRDGDGVPDSRDRCPDEPGPPENDGCPRGATPIAPTVTPRPEEPQQATTVPATGVPPTDMPPPTQTPIPVPSIRRDGACSIAPHLGRANIRAYPSTDAEIVGQLLPGSIYPVVGMAWIDGDAWFALADGWVSGVAVIAGGLCGEVPRLDLPSEGLVPPDTFDESWPEEWSDFGDTEGPVLVFDFPNADGGTVAKHTHLDVVLSSYSSSGSSSSGDPHALSYKLTDLIVTSYTNDEDGTRRFDGGYVLTGIEHNGKTMFAFLVLPDPQNTDPGALFVGLFAADGSVKIANFADVPDDTGGQGAAGLLLPYIEQDNLLGFLQDNLLLPYFEGGLLLSYLEQDGAPGVAALPAFEVGINPSTGAGGGPHVKVFDGASNTDGTSAYFDLGTVPPDPGVQTREHILLARQVGVPAAADGSVAPGDGSVVPADSPWPPPGSLVFTFQSEPSPAAMLLPAVQKIRVAR